MAQKLNTGLIVKTATAGMSIVYIVCAIGYIILPTKIFEILWKPMFHAPNLQPVGLFIVIGFIEAIVYTALAVWLLVSLYNYFAKNR